MALKVPRFFEKLLVSLIILASILCIVSLGYVAGLQRARTFAISSSQRLHSRPAYHGLFVVICAGLPCAILLFLWLFVEPVLLKNLVLGSLPSGFRAEQGQSNIVFTEIQNVANGSLGSSTSISEEISSAADYYKQVTIRTRKIIATTLFCIAITGFFLGLYQLSLGFKARELVEKTLKALLFCSSCIAILTTVGIIFSLIFESYRFFTMVPIGDFLFGTKWSPQVAMRSDQAGSSGAFGAIPLLTGTFLIAAIALAVAVPLGLMAAIYLSEYASNRTRALVKPVLEVLAGIPTVVYGFFAALTVAPFVRDVGSALGLSVSSESALAAGLVMGVMIIPFVSSLSDDVINSVPQNLRDGSFALGATKSETIKKVVFPAALPGVVAAVLLAASRAIGETMIVVMAAGLAANLTINPLDNVTTVTVQIVTALVGDQEFDSPKTLSVFALGLVLFFITLTLNIIALQVVKRYREKYE